MQLNFYKFQGTGNDFIMIDNRNNSFKKDTKIIQWLCDRRFGIGADGLILLENDNSSDFKMIYFNADGNESSMCGNGGRCIVAFAQKLNLIHEKTTFNAIDGIHEAFIDSDFLVHLKMNDVENVQMKSDAYFLDTGSPHHISWKTVVEQLNVKSLGAAIRYSNEYNPSGCNVNFVEIVSTSKIKVRTYERGVEDETLSCGTGVTAAAIAYHFSGKTQNNFIEVRTRGGILKVKFEFRDNKYQEVFLIGPAQFVFQGIINLPIYA